MLQTNITKKNLKLLKNTSQDFDILVNSIRSLSNKKNVKSMDYIQSILKLSFQEPLIFKNIEKINNLSAHFKFLIKGVSGLNPKFYKQIKSSQILINQIFKKHNLKEKKLLVNKTENLNNSQNKKADSFIYDSWGLSQPL